MPLDWEHETRRYLYVAERGSFARLPVLTRALAGYMLKVFDDGGSLVVGAEDPVACICRIIGAHRGERRLIRQMIPALLADHYLVAHRGALVIRNFIEAHYRAESPKRLEAETALADALARGAIEYARDGGTWFDTPAAEPPSEPIDDDAATNGARTDNERCTNGERTVNDRATKTDATTRNDSPETGFPSVLPSVPLNPPLPPATQGELIHLTPPTRKAKRAKREAEPMPWTIGQMLDAIRENGGAKFIVDPYDPDLSKRFTQLIRSLAASGVTLPDIGMGARFARDGGLGRFGENGLDLRWLATAGNLASLIGRALRGAA